MKIVLCFFSLAWFIFFAYEGFELYNETPLQIKRDSIFIKEHIDPSIAVIENFRQKYRRLPTAYEFKRMKGMDTESLGDTEYTIQGTDNYQLAVWRGDWFEYYNSFNKKYKTNNYSYGDGVSVLLLAIGIGLLPALIWWIIVSRRNRFKANPDNIFC